MTDRLDKLISISTDSLGPEPPQFRTNLLESAGKLGRELKDFLSRRNGLYALESALHVFPAGQQEGVMDLETWNDPNLWISRYDDMARGMVFFAEAICSDQFAIKGEEIVRFEAETGLTATVAANFEEWANLILQDYEWETGWPLAHEWQEAHGALPCGLRLIAKTPFVTGGKYDAANLDVMDAVEAMRFHGDFATQIRDLPDGTKIRIEIVNESDMA